MTFRRNHFFQLLLPLSVIVLLVVPLIQPILPIYANPSTWTIGVGGDFKNVYEALASGQINNNDKLVFISDVIEPPSLSIDKDIEIDGNGYKWIVNLPVGGGNAVEVKANKTILENINITIFYNSTNMGNSLEGFLFKKTSKNMSLTIRDVSFNIRSYNKSIELNDIIYIPWNELHGNASITLDDLSLEPHSDVAPANFIHIKIDNSNNTRVDIHHIRSFNTTKYAVSLELLTLLFNYNYVLSNYTRGTISLDDIDVVGGYGVLVLVPGFGSVSTRNILLNNVRYGLGIALAFNSSIYVSNVTVANSGWGILVEASPNSTQDIVIDNCRVYNISSGQSEDHAIAVAHEGNGSIYLSNIYIENVNKTHGSDLQGSLIVYHPDPDTHKLLKGDIIIENVTIVRSNPSSFSVYTNSTGILSLKNILVKDSNGTTQNFNSYIIKGGSGYLYVKNLTYMNVGTMISNLVGFVNGSIVSRFTGLYNINVSAVFCNYFYLAGDFRAYFNNINFIESNDSIDAAFLNYSDRGFLNISDSYIPKLALANVTNGILNEVLYDENLTGYDTSLYGFIPSFPNSTVESRWTLRVRVISSIDGLPVDNASVIIYERRDQSLILGSGVTDNYGYADIVLDYKVNQTHRPIGDLVIKASKDSVYNEMSYPYNYTLPYIVARNYFPTPYIELTLNIQGSNPNKLHISNVLVPCTTEAGTPTRVMVNVTSNNSGVSGVNVTAYVIMPNNDVSTDLITFREYPSIPGVYIGDFTPSKPGTYFLSFKAEKSGYESDVSSEYVIQVLPKKDLASISSKLDYLESVSKQVLSTVNNVLNSVNEILNLVTNINKELSNLLVNIQNIAKSINELDDSVNKLVENMNNITSLLENCKFNMSQGMSIIENRISNLNSKVGSLEENIKNDSIKLSILFNETTNLNSYVSSRFSNIERNVSNISSRMNNVTASINSVEVDLKKNVSNLNGYLLIIAGLIILLAISLGIIAAKAFRS